MANEHGIDLRTGNEVDIHIRNTPSSEGGNFVTLIYHNQDSIVHSSFATNEKGEIVQGSQHGEVIFTGTNPHGDIRF